MQRTDFLAIGDEAERTIVPALRNRLMLQASQLIMYSTKGLPPLIAPPLSVTGIPERLRDCMWWKKYRLTHEQAWGKKPDHHPSKRKRAQA